MLRGIIIKGVGGLYVVKVEDKTYNCRARGLFRKENITPLVGDKVLVKIEEENNSGYIMEILKRNNELLRPPVANVNQVIIVFAIKDPDPNLWLLDKFLILAQNEKLNVVIVFNKVDLIDSKDNINYSQIYKEAGYKVIHSSIKSEIGLDELKLVLKDKITVFAGPSGVGKSTLLNWVQPNLKLKTGEISHKNNRGKHTTRHTELMELEIGGWVVDTPGFSSLDLNFLDEEDLNWHFKEIFEISHMCKFTGCKHNKEPKCAVKEAVKKGEIAQNRYDNYIRFLEEIQNKRRY